VALGNLAQRFLVAVVAVPIILFIFYMNRPEPTWALISHRLAARDARVLCDDGCRRRTASRPSSWGRSRVSFFYWVDRSSPSTTKLGERTVELGHLAAKPILLFFVVLVPGLYYLFRSATSRPSPAASTATITGIVYAASSPRSSRASSAFFPMSEAATFVVLVLLIAWLADTGGYFAGRFLGKARSSYEASARRTWAGAWVGSPLEIAGVVAMKLAVSVLSCCNLVRRVRDRESPAASSARWCDLAESLIKRSVGVKDSGALAAPVTAASSTASTPSCSSRRTSMAT